MTRIAAPVEFMREALELAIKGLGRTSPNPAVGAVVVRAGRVVGKGYHKKAGLPHAEVEAIRDAGIRAKGADLYVTLEPCNHFGKTPPCTDAILTAGIKRVFTGAADVNPKVSGSGIRRLRRAGVKVVTGVLSDECSAINECYNKFIRKRVPYVMLKMAVSLDGKITYAPGSKKKWISGETSRRLVHGLRDIYDCVLVGSGTVLKDDPKLNVRLVKGRDPKKAVLDESLCTPVNSEILKGERCYIFTSPRLVSSKRAAGLTRRGAEVIGVPDVKNGLDIKAVLRELGRRGIVSVMVEGGARVAASFMASGSVDRMMVFVAPLVIGDGAVSAVASLGMLGKAGVTLKDVSISTVGGDVLVEGVL
ncbi:MAG: bifunctional diaminohydroxyphosphoribosylaminopyrimidine deaminase/5-amino-6-(5-phosphoribosylamino)uracil reductase RibD [Deltaproteobacteria bacterium]|nr:bifunctional diaminohydroxyphosphoribosylaminopyrimidine deaminase/5-amino-6-(5-phosphoribosylamino)uracil reductase RibD [Deltaproteobacteria bacterium]